MCEQNIKLLLFIVWTLNNYHGAFAQDRNVFPAVILINIGDRFDLVDIETINNNGQPYDFIILACQADDEKQHELNADSLTSSSLIIEDIIEFPAKPSNCNICKKLYLPSIVKIGIADREKVIGYEFYLNNQQVERLSTKLPKEETETGEVIEETSFVRMKKNLLFYIMVDTFRKPSGDLETTHSVSKTEYRGDFKSCIDFNLGQVSNTDSNINEIYDRENQIGNLNKFITRGEVMENYLIKQQLAPIDDFDSYTKRLATCTNLNVAPMWKMIALGSWNNIEKKIREVAKIVPLEVSTGTYKKLRLPLLSSVDQQFQEVYLNDIAVPEIYWKLVKEKQPIVQNPEIVNRGIFIFTYNYIAGSKTSDRFCEKSVCKELGWEVESTDFPTGYTYCCTPERTILDTLMYEKNTKFVDFNLKDIL